MKKTTIFYLTLCLNFAATTLLIYVMGTSLPNGVDRGTVNWYKVKFDYTPTEILLFAAVAGAIGALPAAVFAFDAAVKQRYGLRFAILLTVWTCVGYGLVVGLLYGGGPVGLVILGPIVALIMMVAALPANLTVWKIQSFLFDQNPEANLRVQKR